MLTDSYLRSHNYLRVSITDKCNLRCRYCMPPEGVEFLPHDQILRNEEFIDLIRIFIGMGVNKIRFTGGEPFLRKGFIDIIAKTRELFPDLELCLTTNGTLLGDYVEDLHRLKVKKLNISLDTLLKDRYELITGRDYFNRVISNIDKALKTGYFNIKINAVLLEETIHELDDFLEYFKDRKLILRFIEKMPFTEEDKVQSFFPAEKLIEAFSSRGKLIRNEKIDTRVAIMYDFIYRDKYLIKIGVIPPLTHKFCSSCNRLRLTSEGKFKTCLHSPVEYDLKTPLRMGDNADKLKRLIIKAVNNKEEEHNLDCYSQDGGCASLSGTSQMSKIGG